MIKICILKPTVFIIDAAVIEIIIKIRATNSVFKVKIRKCDAKIYTYIINKGFDEATVAI